MATTRFILLSENDQPLCNVVVECIDLRESRSAMGRIQVTATTNKNGVATFSAANGNEIPTTPADLVAALGYTARLTRASGGFGKSTQFGQTKLIQMPS